MHCPGVLAALNVELHRRRDAGLSTDMSDVKMGFKLHTYDVLGLVAELTYTWPDGSTFVLETTEMNLFLAPALARNGMLGGPPPDLH